MDKQFEEFVRKTEKELFQTEKFKAMGKGEDYIFQALVFAGKASEQLSLSATVLEDLSKVPTELKEELKSIQIRLCDFKENLRNI